MVTIAIVRQRSLFGVVILTGIYSFLMASVLIVLDAVDVAMTEASVGAGVSTVLLLATLHLIRTTEIRSVRIHSLALLVSAGTGAVLVWGTLVLPPFGTPDAVIHKHVAPRYLADSIKETNVPNVVTSVLADYLELQRMPQVGELTIFCGAMAGAGVGFLWYNTYPASVFMGDVGSLSLGGALGMLALITKNELTLVIVGGIFVLETVSVVLQVASFKLTGRRIFLMAPIHHHFEKKGWAEPKIIVRFWIISILFAIMALSTLKLR